MKLYDVWDLLQVSVGLEEREVSEGVDKIEQGRGKPVSC